MPKLHTATTVQHGAADPAPPPLPAPEWEADAPTPIDPPRRNRLHDLLKDGVLSLGTGAAILWVSLYELHDWPQLPITLPALSATLAAAGLHALWCRHRWYDGWATFGLVLSAAGLLLLAVRLPQDFALMPLP